MFYQLGREWDLTMAGVIVTVSSRIFVIYQTLCESIFNTLYCNLKVGWFLGQLDQRSCFYMVQIMWGHLEDYFYFSIPLKMRYGQHSARTSIMTTVLFPWKVSFDRTGYVPKIYGSEVCGENQSKLFKSGVTWEARTKKTKFFEVCKWNNRQDEKIKLCYQMGNRLSRDTSH